MNWWMPDEPVSAISMQPVVIFEFFHFFTLNFLRFPWRRSEPPEKSGASSGSINRLCMDCVWIVYGLCRKDSTGSACPALEVNSRQKWKETGRRCRIDRCWSCCCLLYECRLPLWLDRIFYRSEFRRHSHKKASRCFTAASTTPWMPFATPNQIATTQLPPTPSSSSFSSSSSSSSFLTAVYSYRIMTFLWLWIGNFKSFQIIFNHC